VPELSEPRKATWTEARALAHPLRLRLIELLRIAPSTASRLARELGESSGATSYHLRVLARVGLIEDDPEHSGGRERWWRRRDDFLLIAFDPDDPEGRALEAKKWAHAAETDDQALRRFVAGEPDLERSWRAPGFVGNWHLYLSPEEAAAFNRRLFALVREASKQPAERAPDARRVLVSYRLLPWIS
jgi:DNA-binding transcriptional ArsR family regulator